MYNDLFTIGRLTVHGYGASIAVGLLLALMVASIRAKKRGMNDDICYGITFVAAICGFLGAKLMYCFVEWDKFIADPASFLSSSGFVVYGGITGGILSVLIYTKIRKVSFLDYLELCTPSVAIAQGFGRIGCFLAGCCYGKPTDAWYGIAFKNSDFAPNGVKLIPAQLVSAGADFLNMAVLLFIAKHTKKRGTVLSCYIIFYSVGRFFIEMLRSDERGTVGAFSTSQFYGIFSLAVGLAIFIWANVHKEKPAFEEEKPIIEGMIEDEEI